MKYRIVILILFFMFAFTQSVRADYVLPYPSYMPGNKIYKISRIIDKVKFYWYFGNIAKEKYYMGLTDKYLVEAKTLFDYKQYLLAVDALTRSDNALIQVPQYIDGAQRDGVDTKILRATVSDAMTVHLSVLTDLKGRLPENFVWRPEKAKASDLQIAALMDSSIALRKQIQASLTK